MRAYVITDDIVEDMEVKPTVVCVTSSRKIAINACEEFLNRTSEQGVIKWGKQAKHTGYATLGDHTAAYQMYFVNQGGMNKQ